MRSVFVELPLFLTFDCTTCRKLVHLEAEDRDAPAVS